MNRYRMSDGRRLQVAQVFAWVGISFGAAACTAVLGIEDLHSGPSPSVDGGTDASQGGAGGQAGGAAGNAAGSDSSAGGIDGGIVADGGPDEAGDGATTHGLGKAH